MTIYFVEMEGDGRIKIGFTAGQAERRVAQLQTGQPQKLRLIGTIPGDMEGERGLHQEFEYLRGNGEWFEPAKELLSTIAFLIENQKPWYFCRANRVASDVWESAFRPRKTTDLSAYEDCAFSLSPPPPAKIRAMRLRAAKHRTEDGKMPAWFAEALRGSGKDARRVDAYAKAWAE